MGRYLRRPIFFAILVLELYGAAASEAAAARPFYEGKTINMIISTSPGGATDVAGRLAARHLGKSPVIQTSSRKTCREPAASFRQIILRTSPSLTV